MGTRLKTLHVVLQGSLNPTRPSSHASLQLDYVADGIVSARAAAGGNGDQSKDKEPEGIC